MPRTPRPPQENPPAWGQEAALRRRKPRGYDLAPTAVQEAIKAAALAAPAVMWRLIQQASREGPDAIEAARLVLAYGVGKPVAEQEQYSEAVQLQRVELAVITAPLPRGLAAAVGVSEIGSVSVEPPALASGSGSE